MLITYFVLGLLAFIAFNTGSFFFYKKALSQISLEDRLKLSNTSSEFYRYSISALIVYSVFSVIALKKIFFEVLPISLYYSLLLLTFCCCIGYFLLRELKKRPYGLNVMRYQISAFILRFLGLGYLILAMFFLFNKLSV
jgi:hypothetical protein